MEKDRKRGDKMQEKVEVVIEKVIRPLLAMDGGSIELVSVDDIRDRFRRGKICY